MDEKLEESIRYYTSYLCGVLDTLVEFEHVISAASKKMLIKEVLESVAKDAYALGQESKK